MKNKIVELASWINERIVGNVWTFIICCIFVILIYIALPIQGYAKWNTSTGLFSNTAESSFELITGVGAVVAVVSLHRKHKKDIDDLHHKIDANHEEHGKTLYRIEDHMRRKLK